MDISTLANLTGVSTLADLAGLSIQSTLCALVALILYRLDSIERNVRRIAERADDYHAKVDKLRGVVDIIRKVG